MTLRQRAFARPVLASVADAERVERLLGCPFDPAGGMSLAAALRADEAEAEPVAGYEAAWAAGLHEYLVPVAEGGRLASFESLLGVLRAMSRRDLAVAVGLGSTFLAATPVWIWGTAEQRGRVAELVLDRRWGTAGISEDAAGSDLLATATRATALPGGTGWRLTGRKWLVGNGARSSFATVLAAAEPSFGLFLLDFEQGAQGVSRLPKVRTLGLRGHDLSGFELADHPVPAAARIGRPGRGVEMVAGMLQFTRTLVGGMSLGAADTALRIALRHARDRRLYGGTALDLPPVRALLARGFADLLAAECTQLTAARGLDLARQRMPLWSAVAKYLVPALCQDTVTAAGEVLSARAYLREGVAGGAFQKIARDAAITPVFEGTQLVQLETVHAQLASGARRLGTGTELPAELLFGFGDPVDPWRPADPRPSLGYGGTDEVLGRLAESAALLAAEDRELGLLARQLVLLREADRAALPARRTPEAYEWARRYCLLHAAACCLHTWTRRRAALGPLGSDPAWLSLALRRLLARLGHPTAPDHGAEHRLVRLLTELDDDDRAFSLLPVRLATQYRDAP